MKLSAGIYQILAVIFLFAQSTLFQVDLPFPKNDFQSVTGSATIPADRKSSINRKTNVIYNRVNVTRNKRNEKKKIQ